MVQLIFHFPDKQPVELFAYQARLLEEEMDVCDTKGGFKTNFEQLCTRTTRENQLKGGLIYVAHENP